MYAGPDCLGRCLYVSGVPGTGKTATVLEVMRSFRSSAGGLPPFQFVEINSLRLPTPQHAYTHLYEVSTVTSRYEHECLADALHLIKS